MKPAPRPPAGGTRVGPRSTPRGRRRVLGGLGAAALGAWLGPARAQPGPTPALRRGLNLTHWFEYDRSQGVDVSELARMRALGLDHVRIPLDPLACGWVPAAPDNLPFLADLDLTVARVAEAGLTAVIDLHLEPGHKATVEADPAYEPLIAVLWTQLARTLALRPPQAVVYELFNEPQYYGAQAWRWPGFQRRLLAAVRQQDPLHLVLLSGNRGGGIDGLFGLWPEPDARAAYTFHFYDPFVFTHQGLPWLDKRWTAAGTRRDVLYPARLHRDRPPTVLEPHPQAAQEWADYMATGWDAEVIRGRIDQVGRWSRARGVRVVCTEFGAIRDQVDAASRHRWMSDVRRALEANGLGWTLWDYTHLFGITAQSGRRGMAGGRSIDDEALRALGLAGPELSGG